MERELCIGGEQAVIQMCGSERVHIAPVTVIFDVPIAVEYL